MSDAPDLLRFLVCGSVDDGKSSLIGRLLYDSKSLHDDQLKALTRSNTADGSEGGQVNLANITDGLRAEREQGITIDVAYRYFTTEKRRFIVADTPGHVQYTRNMVTGASTARLAVIMVDAKRGINEQTKRHAFIANLLAIRHIVIAVNKMDQVSYSQEIFDRIADQFRSFSQEFKFTTTKFIPMSALNGDNVVDRSENIPWYKEQPLLQYLEELDIGLELDLMRLRLPVQTVIRPQFSEFPDFRGYAGQIAAGVLSEGDEVIILPTAQRTKVKEIWLGSKRLPLAFAPQSVTVVIEDDIDIGRGHMIVGADTLPFISKELEADICWMHESPLQLNKKYVLKTMTQTSVVIVNQILNKVNISTLVNEPAANFTLNDIGKIRLKSAQAIVYDDYYKNRRTGCFILIDQANNATVAGGMIREPEKSDLSLEFNI